MEVCPVIHLVLGFEICRDRRFKGLYPTERPTFQNVQLGNITATFLEVCIKTRVRASGSSIASSREGAKRKWIPWGSRLSWPISPILSRRSCKCRRIRCRSCRQGMPRNASLKLLKYLTSGRLTAALKRFNDAPWGKLPWKDIDFTF